MPDDVIRNIRWLGQPVDELVIDREVSARVNYFSGGPKIGKARSLGR